VRAIDWYVDDMVKDPAAVARDAAERCAAVMEEDDAEAIVLGCTIIAACYEKAQLEGLADIPPLPIVNPNVLAVKQAELFADLAKVGQYRISRKGYYQQHAQHDPAEARDVLDNYLGSRTEA
jgi:allantoin racemase